MLKRVWIYLKKIKMYRGVFKLLSIFCVEIRNQCVILIFLYCRNILFKPYSETFLIKYLIYRHALSKQLLKFDKSLLTCASFELTNLFLFHFITIHFE